MKAYDNVAILSGLSINVGGHERSQEEIYLAHNGPRRDSRRQLVGAMALRIHRKPSRVLSSMSGVLVLPGGEHIL